MCTVGVGGVGSPGSGDSATAIPLGVERDSSTSFSWESAAVMAFGYLSGESCPCLLWSRPLRSVTMNTTGSSVVKVVGSLQLSWELLRSLVTKASRVLHRAGHWEL